MMNCKVRNAILFIVLITVSPISATQLFDDFVAIDKVVNQGVMVELAVENVDATQSILLPGDMARFRFFAHDTTSLAPVTGAYPAAWVHPRPADDANDALSCQRKIQQFIGSGLFARAELDLNIYYVVTLNDDATLSVVDPLFGFGGTKLLNMVPLPAIAYDWVKNAAQSYIYVSIPATHEIVKLDTISWQQQSLVGGIAITTKKHSDQKNQFVWQNPRRLVLQDDQRYLWAAVAQGVAVFNTEPFSLAKILKTGAGVEEIRFSSNGRYGFVLNIETQTLSVFDTLNLKLIKTIKTLAQPVSMDYSALAETLFISHSAGGEVQVIDARRFKIIKTIQSEPGLGMIRVAPGGRLVLLVNPKTDRISIIDSSQNRIIQSGIVEDQPDSISFSDELAYISHRGSATLLMITMADKSVGLEGAKIPTVDTPGGDYSPSIKMATPAASIIQSPGSNAVLIANYKDQAVYFFKEGMAAPMGQFNNYSRSPRAVMAIDRSLKEINRPGIYETSARLPKAGSYDVIYYMDNPKITHCFSLTIADNKPLLTSVPIAISAVTTENERIFKVGDPAKLSFQFNNLDAMKDTILDALITLSSGLWRKRQTISLDERGHFSLNFTPPIAGYYQVTIQNNYGVYKQFVYQAK